MVGADLCHSVLHSLVTAARSTVGNMVQMHVGQRVAGNKSISLNSGSFRYFGMFSRVLSVARCYLMLGGSMLDNTW